MTFTHQLLALIVVAIWGTNFVFIRIGLNELEPLTFAALRFILVALPLVFILPKPQTRWRHIASYGVFVGAGQFGLLFWAMKGAISPGLASLVVQMQVFFTVLLSATILHERISVRQWVSLTICFIGLLTIIVFSDTQTTTLGVVIVLLAGLSWSGGNLVIKAVARQAQSINILAFIVWSSLFAVPPLLALAYVTEGGAQIVDDVLALSGQSWLVVIWQVVGNTLIGYGLWNMLLGRYAAALVAPWALLVPVFGMSASAIMLNEPMPWWKLIAAGLILLGLANNMLGNRR